MPNKIQEFSQLAERAAMELTGSHQSWLSFLQTASRLYKYPYNEQLLIHAQRPDATACADFDTWNQRMGRYVRKGSHGIGLIDASGDTPKMKYVFDVSDTVESGRARQLNLWEYKPEHIEAVSAAMEKTFGVDGVWNLPILLDRTATQLVDEYWQSYKRDIFDIVADSYLEGYDEYNIEMQFRNAATVSIGYVLLNRCGLDPESYYTREDFLSVFDFNTPEAANALGTAVSEISREVLRELERTIRNFERSAEHERTQIQDRGRGSDTGNEPQRDIPDAAGQVRTDAESLPSAAETDPVEPAASVGDAVQPSPRDRGSGAVEADGDDAGADEIGGSDGADEGGRLNEVDGADEQSESPGGGDYSPGADLQLTFFLTEEEQKEIIRQTEGMDDVPSVRFIRQSDIDTILRIGSNTSPARMHVITEFSKQKSNPELAGFLKTEYKGGYGLKGSDGDVAAWYSEEGIRMCPDRSARYSKASTLLSWEDAAERIHQLLLVGLFASNVEIAEAPLRERTELAQSLWYLYHDLSEEAHKEGYLDVMETVKGGGFPDESNRLTEQLANADFRKTLTEQFAAFWMAREQDRTLLRFSYHNLNKIYASLKELDLPRAVYSSSINEMPEVQGFITEDEINQALSDGSSFDGGKGRIYEYFQTQHTTKEQADFLKAEYGIGGRSHALSGAAHSSEDHSAKGISLKKAGCTEVQLSWMDVAKRIGELIRKDRYLTPLEHEKYDAVHEASTTYNAVKEQNPDSIVLYQVGDFFEMYGEDAKTAAPELELYLSARDIPNVGRVAMCGIPAHRLESYTEKLREKHDVTISAVNEETRERRSYTLLSVDHEAERASNEQEAEFGADGFRAFHGNVLKEESRQELTQEDIDQSLIQWNNDPESKARMVSYMREHGRERDAAQWLAGEYSVEAADTLKFANSDTEMKWPQVQRRLLQLLNEGRFDERPENRGVFLGERGNTLYFYAPVSFGMETDFAGAPPLQDDQRMVIASPVCYHSDEFLHEHRITFLKIGRDIEEAQLEGLTSSEQIAAMEQAENVFSTPEGKTYHVGDHVIIGNDTDGRSEIVIENADADYVYYTFPDLPEQEPVEILRVQFDAYVDDARFTVIQPEVPSAEMSPERMEQLVEAFEAAGYTYDNVISYGGYLVFHGEGGSGCAFQSWEEAEEWINGVIFDEPERNEAVEKVLHPERYETVSDPYARPKELITSYLQEEFSDEDPETAFEDYHKIPLAYSTDGDGNVSFQVYADIVENRIDFLSDYEHLASIEFKDQDELCEYLANLSFDEIIGYAENEYNRTQSPDIALSDESAKRDIQILSDAEYARNNLIPGETVMQIDGRNFVVDSVDADMGTVSLRDNTFAQSAGFPIFRNETIASIRQYLEKEPKYTTETVAYYSAEENHLPYDVVFQTIHIPDREPPTPTSPTPENFRITDKHLGEGGPKAKFRMNMEAIKLLKKLEQEDREATPEEQSVLSKYVGWGGLADALDDSKSNWTNEYTELKNALTGEEYSAARASTLNAHYTSPVVIKAIYEAVGNMGFQTGNILEPAMGIGNFFGLLPEEMQHSKLYGVELDSITGRIAKKLYPKAEITVAGFETTDRRDFYDLAIGNVPFGQYQVDDKAYNKLGFSIHDYFFAKSIDQVRPGGVIAFVTSRYTLDKQSPEVRKYIAQRADFLGAIRLPNTAFKENAGTDVVSDIIFLQKRDRPLEIEPDWVHLGQNPEGYAINSYFTNNPHMVLGVETSESTQYGRQDYTVKPRDEGTLAEHLHEAVKYIQAEYREAELPDIGDNEVIDTSIPADPNVKNFSYTVVDGEVYFRENSRMVKPELNATAKERVKGMVELRDCVHRLINMQMDSFTPDSTISNAQSELNSLYDRFTEKYGLINSRANALAFADDSSYYLLCSLEILDEDNNLQRKADMFTKRTIKPHRAVDSVDTSSEALAVSIAEKARVDMEYMMQLTGKPESEIVSNLRGVIFLNPMFGLSGKEEKYLTADEYLSGNVREKLAAAKQSAELFPDDYTPNVEALQSVQPVDLDASEIEVRLGATWIDKEYIQQFMFETFETPMYLRYAIQVNYSPYSSEWNISGKNNVNWNNVAAYMTYGTEYANAYKILEDTLNLRDVRIYDTIRDPDGKERRVLNSKQTTLAQQKQQAIKDAFQEWIWRDPERRHTLVTKYNELFNSNRPREYDGSHIIFSGMNPEIRLREHQQNAVAHILYGGNTLLAHEVGAGKTFEMVASAMESKRLGLCQKALFAVPNHLTEQWAAEFLRLYPSANILVATKKDFETRNRKKFCARIATGDYDAVIIGHSQFERIPVSQERQERLIEEQIDEITDGIAEAKASRAEKFTIKSMERTKRGLEARLKKLQDSPRDDVVTFEQLGVDRLYVDEAHNYKNLFLYTKMRNVAGLSTTDAQKSSDMYLKCRYIDELSEGKGIIFATGTPVSNSMTELYTMMRYLQHDMLQKKGLNHFDSWASAFGETVTAIELAPEGTGYRARTRFAKFFNLPELMRLFKDAADIKTADQLNLPTPKAIYHNEVSQPTEIQKEMVKELSERASKVHAGIVNATEDNMLKITSDGRKLGLDQRIINPDLPDDPNSKVNKCVDNIYRIWDEGQPDKLTQLVFCDLSTPKGIKTDGKKAAKSVMGNLDSPEINALIGKDPVEEEQEFSVYDDIRRKLVEKGIPREQISFIHEANTEVRKKELFAKVRSGQVRVLMGSTFKMGAGMNVQDRLIALHDLDAPWRPGDLEQRSGRIIRQGNKNPEVHIFRYVTESTFDAYLWQTLENKQKFISQIMTSKSPVRSCEDVDETALSFAEIKALCAGDERIKEKMDLDVDVARLKLMKANHQSQQFRLEDNLMREFPKQVDENKGYIAGFQSDLAVLEAHPHPADGFAGMEVKGDKLIDKDNAGAALLETFKDVKGLEPIPIGSYRGFSMFLSVEDFGKKFMLTLKGKMSHRVELGKDARGNLIRIDNALSAMPERMNAVQARLDSIYEQIGAAKEQLGKPFPQEEELRVKSARLAELNIALNIDNRSPMEQLVDDGGEEVAKAAPTLAERLQRKNEYSHSNNKSYKEEER